LNGVRAKALFLGRKVVVVGASAACVCVRVRGSGRRRADAALGPFIGDGRGDAVVRPVPPDGSRARGRKCRGALWGEGRACARVMGRELLAAERGQCGRG